MYLPLVEDPIDELWDELHPPRPHEIRPLPEGTHVDPIREIDGLFLRSEIHLVLAWTWADLGKALDRLRAMTPPRVTVDKLTSHLPILLLGNEHWTVIQEGLEKLPGRNRQAFIGTMNTFVIDCFGFSSLEDVQERILFADGSARFSRMGRGSADEFFEAYKTGIQHTSEILRTMGIW